MRNFSPPISQLNSEARLLFSITQRPHSIALAQCHSSCNYIEFSFYCALSRTSLLSSICSLQPNGRSVLTFDLLHFTIVAAGASQSARIDTKMLQATIT